MSDDSDDDLLVSGVKAVAGLLNRNKGQIIKSANNNSNTPQKNNNSGGSNGLVVFANNNGIKNQQIPLSTPGPGIESKSDSKSDSADSPLILNVYDRYSNRNVGNLWQMATSKDIRISSDNTVTYCSTNKQYQTVYSRTIKDLAIMAKRDIGKGIYNISKAKIAIKINKLSKDSNDIIGISNISMNPKKDHDDSKEQTSSFYGLCTKNGAKKSHAHAQSVPYSKNNESVRKYDVIIIELDFENNTISFYKNAQYLGIAYENITNKQSEFLKYRVAIKTSIFDNSYSIIRCNLECSTIQERMMQCVQLNNEIVRVNNQLNKLKNDLLSFDSNFENEMKLNMNEIDKNNDINGVDEWLKILSRLIDTKKECDENVQKVGIQVRDFKQVVDNSIRNNENALQDFELLKRKLNQRINKNKNKNKNGGGGLALGTKMDTSEYMKWELNDIMKWINSLENGKFEQYDQILKQKFNDNGITSGMDLCNITAKDLENKFGIESFADRVVLHAYFQQLENDQQEGGNEGEGQANLADPGATNAVTFQ